MLPDIQDEMDSRGIELDHVGISNVRCPVNFNDQVLRQSSVGSFDMTVALPHDRRGTHMSRMVELINDHLLEFDPYEIPRFLKSSASKLEVETVEFQLRMPIAMKVRSPASNLESWQPSDMSFSGRIENDSVRVRSSLTSQVTSLCPCSKAISDYGAHNQRSEVRLTVVGYDDAPYPLSISDAFEMIRRVGSCPIYPLVKRPDEREITMTAFEHPAFVEDMVRDLSNECRTDGLEHLVEVRNFESIHSHDAIASVSWAPVSASSTSVGSDRDVRSGPLVVDLASAEDRFSGPRGHFKEISIRPSG